eukprot:s884_g25.t1
MQESSDIWPLVRHGSWSLLTACGRILGVTLLGALLGAVLGFVGAPVTLGSSLFFAPILGAMLGAFVGAFRCVRYFAGLLEALLLYHPRKSRDLSFMEMTWDLADVEYSLQTVSYDLPEVGSQTAYLLRPSGDIDTLWVFFGGNAMLARDWLSFCDKVLTHTSRTTNAFLLVDYPGYGRNAGVRSHCTLPVEKGNFCKFEHSPLQISKVRCKAMTKTAKGSVNGRWFRVIILLGLFGRLYQLSFIEGATRKHSWHSWWRDDGRRSGSTPIVRAASKAVPEGEDFEELLKFMEKANLGDFQSKVLDWCQELR